MRSEPLTFLFTDLVGSTRLWEQFPDAMHAVLARHDTLLHAAVLGHNGMIVKTTGDGLHAVFESPLDAALTAARGQQSLAEEDWPLEIGPVQVRMGIHTGTSRARGGDYYGPNLNKAARIMSAGSGGQILCSAVTARLLSSVLPNGIWMDDLGEHLLQDLSQPAHLFQLGYSGMPESFPELRTLEVFKHNLPPQLTSFIGRETEIKQIRTRLKETRLLTLLGPGGTGKTRLMLQAAAELLEDFEDGIWLVELAPLTDPELIPDQAAAVLGLHRQDGRPLIDILADHLRRKKALLLLDNVEHLVAESADFTETLLLRCQDLKILVTGRESLFIAGEATLQVPSLQISAQGGQPTLETALSSEAVQLFIERAQAVRADFQLDTQSAPVIAGIVKRLDGIPNWQPPGCAQCLWNKSPRG
jgi:class 3 adenylate cyclase